VAAAGRFELGSDGPLVIVVGLTAMADASTGDGSRPMLPRRELTTPRSGAIAGILFAVLLGPSLVVLKLSVPIRQEDAGQWLSDPDRRRIVRWALNLVPFAGIAFLWFIGVVRDRIGAFEDRFFSTVFLRSGLLFLALLFAATAVAGGLVESYATADSTDGSGLARLGVEVCGGVALTSAARGSWRGSHMACASSGSPKRRRVDHDLDEALDRGPLVWAQSV
jgi:hypothetical protein